MLNAVERLLQLAQTYGAAWVLVFLLLVVFISMLTWQVRRNNTYVSEVNRQHDEFESKLMELQDKRVEDFKKTTSDWSSFHVELAVTLAAMQECLQRLVRNGNGSKPDDKGAVDEPK